MIFPYYPLIAIVSVSISPLYPCVFSLFPLINVARSFISYFSGYLCVSVFAELGFGFIDFSLLLCVCVFVFVDHIVFCPRLVSPYYWGKTLFLLYPRPLWKMGFSVCVSTVALGGSFPSLGWFPHMLTLIDTQQVLEGVPLQIAELSA